MTLFESPRQLKSVAGKRIGNYNGIRYYRMQNKHRGQWSGWPIIRILVTGSGQWSLVRWVKRYHDSYVTRVADLSKSFFFFSPLIENEQKSCLIIFVLIFYLRKNFFHAWFILKLGCRKNCSNLYVYVIYM